MNIRPVICIISALLLTVIHFTATALTIMPMGDSITTGIDFLTNSQGGYRDPLQNLLVSGGISFNFVGVSTANSSAALTSAGNQYHNGYSGWKIDDLQKNLNGNVQANPGDPNLGGYWITGGNGTGRGAQLPDILLLHVGGNDIVQHYDPQTSNPSEAQFIADMGQRLYNLCTAFHALSPNTIIMVASVIPVNIGAAPMSEVQGLNVYIQNTLVPSLSYTRFVDQYSGFVNADGSVKTQLLGTDNVHPTGAGYQTMALKWQPAIQAYLSGGGSVPAAPTGLSATGGNGQVSLSWTASSGATSYNVYRGTTAGGESTTPFATGITATSWTNTGLNNGTAYYYKVAAVNSIGTSGYSNEASATPSALPAAPTGLSATAGNGQVNLSWTASSGATSYNVYRGTSAGGESTTPFATGITGTTWTNTGLNNGTTYYYKVAAVNSVGTSGYSNEASATPSAGGGSGAFANAGFETPQIGGYSYSPAGSSWTFTNNAGIQHNGSAYSGTATIAPEGTQTGFVQGVGGTLGTMSQSVNFSTAGSYTISFQAARRYGTIQPVRVSVDGTVVGTYSPASDSFALITTASFSVTTGSHTILFAATDSSADKTSFIDLVSLSNGGGGGSAPAAPTGLSATGGNGQVSLSWTASSGATSYNVYRGTSAGGESTTPIATGITGTTFTNTGLTNGTTYYYKVAAVNSSGTSGYSNEASATPSAGGGGVPAAPTSLGATGGNGQVSLSWTASSGATSYNVYRGTTSNGESATPIATGISSTTYTDTGLTNGTAYYYKVAAVNSSGTSGYSNEASATPAGGGGGSATFANAGFETPQIGGYTYSSAGTSWTFTNNAGIQHNGSAYSGSAAVAPEGTQTGFVQGVGGTLGTMSQSVSFSTAGSYTISFRAARRYGTIQPIQVSVDGTTVGTYSPASDSFALITTASFSVTTGNHTILFAATDSSADKSSFIDLVSLSSGGGGGSAPAAPTGLSATGGNGQVSLSWTASSGATSYNVYRGTAANGESATPIATGISGTTYTNTGLTNGTTYYYKVAAVNSSGTSGYSNEASAMPAAGGGGTATFANASFETPQTGGYTYTPSGSSWTFTNNAGIQHNGSAYSGTTTVAPDGTQTALVQGVGGTLGTMTQSVNFNAGTYTIKFQAARRYGIAQPIRVSVDGTTVGTYTPASDNFALINTASFTVTAGSHTVTFAATDSSGDKTSFIDLVSIQ